MAGCDENCVLRQLRQLLDTMLTRAEARLANRGEHYEAGAFPTL